MKTKEEMSLQDSEQAPVTLQDVSACFSEEEWTLLHEWQKELYKNVMKEIHQALISLGPAIATAVFSLRAKEKEYPCPAEHQESERRNSNDHCLSAATDNYDELRYSREESQYLKDLYDTDRRESNDHLGTGFPDRSSASISREEQEVQGLFMDDHTSKGGESSGDPSSGHEVPTPITLFGINQEGETYVMASRDSEIIENIISPSGFPSHKAESETSFIDHSGVGGGERNTSANPGDTHADFDVIIKSEQGEKLYSEVPGDLGPRQMHESLSTGNTHADFNVFIKSEREERLYSEVPGDLEERETVESFSTDNPVITSVFSLCDENEEETHLQELDREGKSTARPVITSVFSLHHYLEGTRLQEKPKERTSVCQPSTGIMKAKAACKCKECEKSFTRKEHLVSNQEMHIESKPFSCMNCEKTFSIKTSLQRHQKFHMEERPFSCTGCEMSFRLEPDLLVHQRSHTVEKPFSCTECGKNFTRKSTLVIHLRTHTGDRPFSCTECEKSFIRKQHLELHMITHTGVRPYPCTVCEKSFNRKQRLALHMVTHSSDRPYPCTVCEKSFITKQHLALHMTAHTGDRPFPCTECEKSFFRKELLVLHLRTHTPDQLFSCTKCEKNFRRKSNLKRHHRIHSREAKLEGLQLGTGQLNVKMNQCSVACSTEYYPSMP